MACSAIKNGPAKAACHFSEDLGREVTESTIRSTQTLFQRSPSKNTLSVLPYSPRGRPLKLEQYDDLVKAYIRRLRVAGGVVNAQTVITGAEGIVLFKDSTLLQKKMGQDWHYQRMDTFYVEQWVSQKEMKPNDTKENKHFLEDYEDIKGAF